MYEQHWQLQRPAFRAHFPAEFFFAASTHQAALLKLRYLTEQRPGLAVVTGASGTGKSFLLETMRQQFALAGPVVTSLFPQLTASELLAYVTSRLSEPEAQPLADVTRLDLVVRQLESRLHVFQQQGLRPVLILDDAHLIEDPRVWPTLLSLLNLQPSDPSPLSIILIGAPELLGRLKRFGSLFERLELTCVLQPLTAEETATYVRHRLLVAGASTAIFDEAALAAVHALSGGLPRRINRVCDFALLVGYADERLELTAHDIEAIADELRPLAA